MKTSWLAVAATALVLGGVGIHAGALQPPPAASAAGPPPDTRAVLDRYCVSCHNDRLKTGGVVLSGLDPAAAGPAADIWEKTLRKLRARAMPPAGSSRPDDATYRAVMTALEATLDRAAKTHPNPGRPDPFRRLNRTEYQRAIRHILDLDVDVADLLPNDDASHGFDNVSVAGLSPTLMERYLSAAQKISRLAVGSPVRAPASRVVVLPPDLTQEAHFDGLPFGTRGGAIVSHTFPVDGEYTISLQLSRDRNENVEGLTEPHEIEVTLDGQRLTLFTVRPNRNRLDTYYADENVDKGLTIRVPVQGGPHEVGVAFLQNNAALVETERQPYQSRFNMDRHPRVQPAVRSVAIAGPFESTGVGDTPSRRRIFVCRPASPSEDDACARTILTSLARRAYRRPVTDRDLQAPMAFFRDARADGGFEAGIEMALRALLASTEFLFRIERDPDGLASGSAYRLSDVVLASRLSFFLWSGPPDDTLLDLAERGTLSQPEVLEQQVRRMLADPRAGSLATNFASQWLYLRNLAAARPDGRLFPDFDDNLRQSFRRETELLVASIVDEDRSVTDVIGADYTFLNERLAKHYGIANVYGDHFRRVALDPGSPRAGLLGHGSMLTVTSYATRTSPVLRGKWILDNIMGMPPPPPPPNVPALADGSKGGSALTMRDRMAAHRTNPTCASCHQMMDPVGLAMENFDAIGRWRQDGDGGTAIDATGALPGGQKFEGIAGLRQAVLARPEIFVTTMTEKLLTFALGRGLEPSDGPAVREIVRRAAGEGYRFSSIVVGVTRSVPFTMRRSQ